MSLSTLSYKKTVIYILLAIPYSLLLGEFALGKQTVLL